MAEEADASAVAKKRKFRSKTRNKPKKKMKLKKGIEELGGERSKMKIRNSLRMKKLFKKRAREYNSDDDGDDDNDASDHYAVAPDYEEGLPEILGEEQGESDAEGKREGEEAGYSEDEGDEIQPGITKFAEGCRAFRVAFMKIMKKNVSDDLLGPVLSGHKKLIALKLAEEEEERKVKGVAKKEKHLIAEKGHVKPSNFLDTKERFLISVATKGVVKLFNAVNKAQNVQKGLNPSKFKDAKVIGKRRKEAFFSELRKTSGDNAAKGVKPTEPDDNEEPTWAPLRDSFMLSSSKWKDWDKMPDPTASIPDEMPLGGDSSDDE